MNTRSFRGRRPCGARLNIVLLAIISCAFSLTASAAEKGKRENFDAFLAVQAVPGQVPVSTLSPMAAGGAASRHGARPVVPAFMWLDTARSTAGKGMSFNAVGTPRGVLRQIAPLYGLTESDVETAVMKESVAPGGSRIATFTQEIDGIEVWRDQMSILFDPAGRPVAVSGSLASSSLRTNGSEKSAISRERAAAIAASDALGLSIAASAFQNSGRGRGGYDFIVPGKGVGLQDEIRIKQVLYRMPDRLIAAYYLEIWVPDEEISSHLWGYVISAEDGSLLNRTSLTESESFSYRVWADPAPSYIPFQGPTADSMPHPTGLNDGSFPPYVTPNLIALQNVPFSQNDPWLPMGASETNGNNVDAYADISGPDGFNGSDIRATTTAPNAFDRTYDVTAEPGVSADQRMASVTQLFYTINYLHDWFYDAGFDELAGNAQADNYGRGGIDGDSIRGEAQDYSGTNNANMSTPADGGRPRMQMYLWSARDEVSLVTSATGASSLATGTAAFGPQEFNVSGDVVLADDGTGTLSDACEAVQNDLTGKVALVDRGTCGFRVKVKNAQTAGAIGVIIADNGTGLGNMGGTDATITIPSLMVAQADGSTIKAALTSPVTATMTRTVDVMYDGTIDNGIVAHEWGHYLSNRLITLGTNQSRAMGEGWSDFVSLLMLVREGDDPDGVYSFSQYALQGIVDDPGYFGIRRYPYSTDMNVNPLTFKHIESGVALPSGPPIEPNGNDNAQVHNSGEVWAQMLWDCYAALLKAHPFAEAQQRMKNYLVASMKMTPAYPTYTEARDALLAVAYAADPPDHALFCAAFSKRGIGVGAVSPDRYSTTHAGVVESFVCGGDLAFVSATLDDSAGSCDFDGVLDKGEIGLLTLRFRNTGSVTLTSSTVTLTSSNPDYVFPDGMTASIPPSSPYETVVATVNVTLADTSSGLEVLDLGLTYTDPVFAIPGDRTANAQFLSDYDDVMGVSTTDEFEAEIIPWSQTGIGASGEGWFRRSESVSSHYLHADNVAVTSDVSLITPPLQVDASSPLIITFDHRHSFEYDGIYWDGGVIEISTDGGTTWADVGASASPGYNGSVISGMGNPLQGRAAFVGTSAGWPAWISSTVDLGTAYAGQTVLFRFRIGTDAFVSAYGWDVDNVSVTGITNTPFSDRVADSSCGNLSIGDVAVTEGNTGFVNADLLVTLAGTPPGVTVSVDWQTVAHGDAVAGADFVTASGSLTFLTGETSKVVTVQVAGDVLYEANEVFSVQLSNPVDAVVTDPMGIVTIQNDEVAGIIVSPLSGLVTTEAGGTATFDAVLTSQPAVDVSIDFSSSDPVEGLLSKDGVSEQSGVTLIFGPANWNVPQTVTVHGQDESVVDGDQSYSVTSPGTSSTDAAWNGIATGSVAVTNEDDDVASVVVSPTSGLATTEGGAADQFTVVLTSAPVADVVIGLSSSDTSEGTASPASVTFTSVNWNVPQSVTATGVDDSVIDGDQSWNVVTADAVSVDSNYGGLVVADVAVLNADDDVAGVTASPTAGLTTTEAGGSDTFTIVLTSEPMADVIIGLSSSSATEGAVSPASVTFTSANWNVPQTVTVTGVDDDLADGDQAWSVVTADVVSTDVNYGGLVVADVSVLNADDDAAGVVVSPTTGLTTTEAGGSGTFTIVLATQPTADVVIGLSSSSAAEGVVSPASVTFTAANWNVPQTVTVTGVDDDLADGDQAWSVVTADVVSTDVNYGGLVVADVAVTNADDDAAGVLVSPTSGLTTTEAGGSDTFTIVLTSRPTSDVVIGLSSSSAAEGAVSPASVTFTAADWDLAQTITVTGVDDGLADGDQVFEVVTAAAVSADPAYDGLVVADVTVTNQDDETSPSDSDGDGVDNVIEDAGPNGGDGNGDSVPDSTQSHVATLPAANGNGHLTVISTCELREVEALLKDGFEPTQLLFPYALVEFRLPCASADMTVLYHAGSSWPASQGYWKFGPETPGQALTTKWYQLPGVTFDTTIVAGSTIARARFSLADGVLGDDTGVDGVIVDQGGPGSPGAIAAIPTTGEWGLIMMALMMAAIGVLKLR